MEDFSEEELEKQESTARKYVALVLIPIAILIAIYAFWENNYSDYPKTEYIAARNLEFHGLIVNKYAEGDYPRARRYIYIASDIQEYVKKEQYDLISLGDSAYKFSGSDSVFFILTNGDTLICDRNEFLRKRYEEHLSKR